MRIILPSQGILGIREVDMMMPKYRHIRDLSQMNYSEEEIGFRFVEMLVSSGDIFDKITYQDKDYLLAIAVSALHLNALNLAVTCSCGERVTTTLDMSDVDVIDLDPNTPKEVVKKFGDTEYSYRFSSANDEKEVILWAKDKSDGDPLKYQRLYEEGFVCKTFGFDLSEENLNKVSCYDLMIYYSALLFREMVFHGISPIKSEVCPKCGKKIGVIIPFAKSLMSWNSSQVINEFMTVAGIVGGFDSFLDLTFSELAQMKANQSIL